MTCFWLMVEHPVVVISCDCFPNCSYISNEPHREKTGFLPMRKVVKNKGTDQLHSNCEADQRLCFHYMDSTIPLLLKPEISSF